MSDDVALLWVCGGYGVSVGWVCSGFWKGKWKCGITVGLRRVWGGCVVVLGLETCVWSKEVWEGV